MFLSGIFLPTLLFFAKSADAAQSTVVCVAGQCIQGYTNITIGARLSAPGAVTDIQLLPGSYTTNTDPELLHSLLTNKAATLQSSSQGFTNNGTVSLPLTVALQPGVAVYSQSMYSGGGQFAPLPTSLVGNSSTPITSQSLALSSGIWLSMQSGTDRVVFWSSVPDVAQLPASVATGPLAILDIQSSSCSPACSGNGVCSANGTCTCPTGFTGSSCESCAAGFFGPKCQSCPSNCAKCDEGITGTGVCLTPAVTNPPSSCNCLNGVCGSNGQCTCNPGWTTGTNGTSCSACSTGFFQTDDGNCQVCQLGCTECAEGTGVCITCQTGFTQDPEDRTKCIPPQTASDGTVCPDNTFSNGTTCNRCSPSCTTCSGPTSNDCIICASGTYKLNGVCVTTDGNGVCAGSSLLADNNKHECDSCPSKCTGCQLPGFSVTSTVNHLQCTGCLPGLVLSQGQCVNSCPSGTFLDPTDNTCKQCDASCSSCSGSSNFCLTCANSQLASSGSCVASCPSNTFSSSGVCITCHPDCATCSGGAFNQCSSCPSNRPVLTNGRCLPTCAQNQYFDKTTSTCQACDSSCSSCSGPGPASCLACGDSNNEVLKGGSCVNASCKSSTSVVPGMGVCLSDLVTVPEPSGTANAPPLPTITGINTPAPTNSNSNKLQWWEILLMTLGCAFIFLVILMCWRRRARKQRANKTKQFALAKKLDDTRSWKQRLVRFGERLFGHTSKNKLAGHHTYTAGPRDAKGGDIALRDLEEQRRWRDDQKRLPTYHDDDDLDGIVGAYEYEQSTRSAPSEYSRYYHRQSHNNPSAELEREYNRLRQQKPREDVLESIASRSIYSQVTGAKKRAPEPRMPVKGIPGSRFSMSTSSGSSGRSRTLTAAQEYKSSVQHREPQQNLTGSSNPNNPFSKFI